MADLREAARLGLSRGVTKRLLGGPPGRHPQRYDLASRLIDRGAPVNQFDFWGRTPLYAAVDRNTSPRGGRRAAKRGTGVHASSAVSHGQSGSARIASVVLAGERVLSPLLS